MTAILSPSIRATALLALVLAALQGCGGPPPPPPPPTIAKLTLHEDADANATPSGQGAPTIIRVYQLSTTAGFEKAEFFRLLNGDAALLGADMVKRDEYLVAPGTPKEATITPSDAVTAIGVFAGYRQFQTRTWRVVVPLPPHKTTPVSVAITAAGLVVDKPPAN